MVCTIHMYQLKIPANSLLVQVSATQAGPGSLFQSQCSLGSMASSCIPPPPRSSSLLLLLCGHVLDCIHFIICVCSLGSNQGGGGAKAFQSYTFNFKSLVSPQKL